MPHRIRKVRKLRGSRQHGWGQSTQHRGPGQRGGGGVIGMAKGRRSYRIKYEPDYFGKHGFRYPRVKYIKTINVGELDDLLERLLALKKAGTGKRKPVVDLQKLGYDKLLGFGVIKAQLVVKVPSYSKAAEAKINEAGGQILK